MVKDELMELFTNELMNQVKEKLEVAESDEKAREIINKFEKLDITEMYTNFLKELSKEAVENMKVNMYEEVMSFRADEQEFIARQEQKWYRAFVSSETLYIMVLQAAEAYINYVSELDDNEKESRTWEFLAMQHIHGRAMQEYLEIITLMKNGFADGAYARWRSMYELSIISSFISEHGEKVAKAFVEASETDDRYEWARASGVFSDNKKYITFNDIQKKCDINSPAWIKQYDLANKTVHASPQGTFGRLCNMGDENVIPVGRSDYGITTPAEHSAISLVQITTMFFSIFSFSNIVIAMKGISDWINVIREIYFKTHDEVFPDDEPLWEDGMLDEKI